MNKYLEELKHQLYNYEWMLALLNTSNPEVMKKLLDKEIDRLNKEIRYEKTRADGFRDFDSNSARGVRY